jgi:hypothetical protein
LQKPLSAQIQAKSKMRRLPPTCITNHFQMVLANAKLVPPVATLTK